MELPWSPKNIFLTSSFEPPSSSALVVYSESTRTLKPPPRRVVSGPKPSPATHLAFETNQPRLDHLSPQLHAEVCTALNLPWIQKVPRLRRAECFFPRKMVVPNGGGEVLKGGGCPFGTGRGEFLRTLPISGESLAKSNSVAGKRSHLVIGIERSLYKCNRSITKNRSNINKKLSLWEAKKSIQPPS